MNRLVTILLPILLPLANYGQIIQSAENDSIPTVILSVKNDELGPQPDTAALYLDTTLWQVHNGPPVFYNFQLNLGNHGTPQKAMYLDKKSQPFGFFGGYDHIGQFRFSAEHYRLLLANKPYTELQYLNGSFDEELFSATHVQPVSEKLTLGAQYRSLNSVGMLNSQTTTHRNFILFSAFNSKSRNYFGTFKFGFNKNQLLENGGVANDTAFQNQELGRELLDVHLTGARNIVESREYHLHHKYYPFSVQDTTISPDSIPDTTYSIERRPLFFYHSANFRQINYDFADLQPTADSGFYQSTLFTPTTSDLRSVYSQMLITNKVGIVLDSIRLNRFMRLAIDGSIGHQVIDVSDYVNRLASFNVSYRAKGSLGIGKEIFLNADHQQVVAGNNLGDIRSKFGGRWRILKFLEIGGDYHLQQLTAPHAYQQYYSTSGRWDLKPQKETLNEISVFAREVNTSTTVRFGSGLYSNPVYFNSTGLSSQLKNTNVSYFFTEATTDIEFWKFRWSPKVRIQQYNADILPYPQTLLFNRFLIQGWLFNRNMRANLGVDVSYFSSYEGWDYLPQTRQFYISDNPKVLGDYPYLDVFFAAKVKTARFFVKACHINQGLLGNNQYTFQSYPYHDFSLRLGFSWMFLY